MKARASPNRAATSCVEQIRDVETKHAGRVVPILFQMLLESHRGQVASSQYPLDAEKAKAKAASPYAMAVV